MDVDGPGNLTQCQYKYNTTALEMVNVTGNIRVMEDCKYIIEVRVDCTGAYLVASVILRQKSWKSGEKQDSLEAELAGKADKLKAYVISDEKPCPRM